MRLENGNRVAARTGGVCGIALLALAFASAGAAFGGASLSEDGTTLTLSAEAGETLTYSDALASTLVKVVKIGQGRYVFNPSAYALFKGTVEIQEGVLSGNRSRFGSPSAWKILPEGSATEHAASTAGATLLFDERPDDYFGGESDRPAGSLEIGGSGFERQGAFYFTMLPNGNGSGNTLSTSHKAFAGGVTLTADTTVGGGRFGFGTMDMQGCGLYTYCTNGQSQYEMYGNVKNAGDFHLKKGKMLFERYATFSPAVTTQCVVAANGTTVLMYDSGVNNNMTTLGIRLEDGAAATIEGQGGNASGYNFWTGPVHLDKGRRLSLTAHRELTLKGSMDGEADLYKNGSSKATITSDSTHEFRSLVVEKGTLALGKNSDDSAYRVTNVWKVVGTTSGADCARLDLGPGCRTAANTRNTDSEAIRVGWQDGGGTTFGILSIGDGAVVSNEFRIGVGSGNPYRSASGAVYMDDATVYWKAGVGNDGFIGSNGNGYGLFLQNGGTFTHTGYMNLGAHGRGVFVQRGGLHEIVGWNPIKFARDSAKSYGVYHQAGGTFRAQNGWMCFNNVTNCNLSQAVVTTTGAGARFELATNRLWMSILNVEGVVNVNDGATYCGVVYKDASAEGGVKWNDIKDICPGTKLYVNVDGGVLTAKDRNVLGADASRAPDRVTVYEGGATLDASAVDLVFNAPFDRPIGQGVASIALPKNSVTNFNYYVGPPRIRIKSATGAGATAFADFNEKTRQVERILVTSAGFGYEDATVTIEDNVFGEVALTATLAELSATGGVTKTGAKTATLACANTYGGATRVEGGTLAFTHEDGYPGGDLEFSAAALMDGQTAAPLLRAVKLAFDEGRGIRVTEADTLDKSALRGLRNVAALDTPLASLPPVSFIASDGAEVSPGGWAFSLDDGGRAIRFCYRRATTIILR